MSITTCRRIAAHYIYYRRSLLRNPILSLSSDGVVTGVELCDEPDRREGVEFYDGILVPGFVNAHCHLELSYLRGAIDEGGGFTAFAAGMGRFRNDFTDEQRAAAVADADRALHRGGTAVVADICNGTSSFGTKHRSDIRYHSYLELFGLNTAGADTLRPVAAEADTLGLPHSVTPHSTYSLNCDAFAAAVEGFGGQSTAPLSIHFMESPGEEQLYRGEGDMAVWYASRGFNTDFTHYGSPAQRLVAQVPPARDIMLIHNCCVTEAEIDIVEAHFTGRVTWVLCPRSNDYISRTEPPYGLLRRKGVRIAVGTDSLASNRSLDILAELRTFSDVPLEELLSWATDNGAEAMGLEDEYGSFAEGRRCGVSLIQGIDWTRMALTSGSRIVRIA